MLAQFRSYFMKSPMKIREENKLSTSPVKILHTIINPYIFRPQAASVTRLSSRVTARQTARHCDVTHREHPLYGDLRQRLSDRKQVHEDPDDGREEADDDGKQEEASAAEVGWTGQDQTQQTDTLSERGTQSVAVTITYRHRHSRPIHCRREGHSQSQSQSHTDTDTADRYTAGERGTQSVAVTITYRHSHNRPIHCRRERDTVSRSHNHI